MGRRRNPGHMPGENRNRRLVAADTDANQAEHPSSMTRPLRPREETLARGLYRDIRAITWRPRAPGAMTLSEMRRVIGLTQTQVAAAAHMSQGDLSCFERRDDWLLSSLQRYADGLGGHLEVSFIVGGRRYLLHF
jgi:hypothetical protein